MDELINRPEYLNQLIQMKDEEQCIAKKVAVKAPIGWLVKVE